mmetsp:Transcript_8513/g.7539  ORF Transcript_8513/g.7539 Transcript_8513/m.7539 type:complete len:86 (+) Transcript_8513:973-1230(+)
MKKKRKNNKVKNYSEKRKPNPQIEHNQNINFDKNPTPRNTDYDSNNRGKLVHSHQKNKSGVQLSNRSDLSIRSGQGSLVLPQGRR